MSLATRGRRVGGYNDDRRGPAPTRLDPTAVWLVTSLLSVGGVGVGRSVALRLRSRTVANVDANHTVAGLLVPLFEEVVELQVGVEISNRSRR